MRDLTRERRQTRFAQEAERLLAEPPATNGGDPVVEPVTEPEPPEEPETPTPAQITAARRDLFLSRVAVNLYSAAKLLDPLTRIVMARVLALASLGAAVGICVYAIGKTDGWQRVAIVGGFLALSALLIRKGQA